jgi:hypothetical protein
LLALIVDRGLDLLFWCDVPSAGRPGKPGLALAYAWRVKL